MVGAARSTKRRLLSLLATGAALLLLWGMWASQLALTPLTEHNAALLALQDTTVFPPTVLSIPSTPPAPPTTPLQPGRWLQWTPRAEELILGYVGSMQFPHTCDDQRVLFLTPREKGFFSTLHSFEMALVAAMHLNRTLVPLPNPDKLSMQGLEQNGHGGYSLWASHIVSPTCVKHLEQFTLSANGLNVMDVPHACGNFTDAASPISHEPGKYVQYCSGGKWEVPWCRVPVTECCTKVNLLDSHFSLRGFPDWLWSELLAEGAVVLPLNKAVHPLEQQFMLHAIIGKWLFDKAVSNKEVLHFVQTLPASSLMLGVQVRRSDKKHEDPYWKLHRQYRPVADYFKAVLETTPGNGLPKCPEAVFLISDDPQVLSFAKLEQAARKAREAGKADELCFANLYSDTAATAMSESRAMRNLPDEVNRMLAGVRTMVTRVDYAVVTASSNIGRFIFEYLGARVRIAQVVSQGPLGVLLDGHWHM
eukprot:jgi/Chlat1/7241/Chrsp58S06885